MTTTNPTLAGVAQPEPDDGSAVDGAVLLDQVRDTIAKYCILPSEHAMTGVVLWIAATHAVPALEYAARLVIRAPERRCGKSRLLDMCEALGHNPLLGVNASSSAIARSIQAMETDPPTILLDEADVMFGPKASDSNEDLRGVLNAGHQRNRKIPRYDAGTRNVEFVPTFAMAALAGIGAMPDTIEDRAVVIHMRRISPGEEVAQYRYRRDRPDLDALRLTLNRWIRANKADIGSAMPDMPVKDRAADTWEPLVAIADTAGGRWPTAAREAAAALTESNETTTRQSLQTMLLSDCRTAFKGATALPTSALVERLKLDDEAPWATYGKNGLTARHLGEFLREFDITSETIRFPSGQAKGYRYDSFTDAWNRYCPTPDTGAVGHDDEGVAPPAA
jgi:hypothetical protein